jgi:hypothetical protein
MANAPWQKRIRRAEQLAVQHTFAAEILGFYIHVARFQQSLYQRTEQASAKKAPASLSDLSESPELLISFPAFLSLVEEKAPARFAQVAHDLRNSPSDSWASLLNRSWSETDNPPDTAEEFLGFAFLQPYAEFVRSRAPLQLDGYSHSLCPFCNRKPGIAVLRPQSGLRFLCLRMGIPPHRLCRMRPGRPSQTSGLHRRAISSHASRVLRRLPHLHQVRRPFEKRLGRPSGRRTRFGAARPMGARAWLRQTPSQLAWIVSNPMLRCLLAAAGP